MTRLSTCFLQLKKHQKKALIPYMTAGDPSVDISLNLMNGLVAAGADIIEVGIPYSDPVADGKVIQQAHTRGLNSKTHLPEVLKLITLFRQQNQTTPVVLMTYINPIEMAGYDSFSKKAAKAGVDGVLIVDLPPEESASISPLMHKNGLDCIYLASPTTSDERLSLIAHYCSGYLYYVSLSGVTGSNSIKTQAVAEKINHLRHFFDLPIAVGFGIKDTKTAHEIAQTADGIIIGSALVTKIADNLGYPQKMLENIKQFIADIRTVI